MLILFVVIGAVSATDLNDGSIKEDSNLISNDDVSSSQENKLGISSEDSISETNIVNSHDDNLGNCPTGDMLSASSDYEDNAIQSTTNDSTPLTSTNNDVTSASPKISTKLSIVDTHYGSSATYFKVTLSDKTGKAIYNVKVSLKVNGVTYSGTTNKQGIVNIKTPSLKVGAYTVVLKYGGNSKYIASSISKKVNVLPSVSGKDMKKYYGYVSVYQATFWKYNNPLANTKVSFTVNGKTYTKTTDKNGVAKLDVNLPPGKYVITTTNPFSKEVLKNNIVVYKDGTTINHDLANTYIPVNKHYTYTVTLKSKHNVLIEGARVIFEFNNEKVTTKTDQNGKASITIPVLPEGAYPIKYSFAENNLYSGSQESRKIYVQTPKAYFKSSKLNMVYNDGSKFVANLKDSNNNPLANKYVKFTLDGKEYSVKTNKYGNAFLNVGNLKVGTHTVKFKYQSMGYKFYASGKNTIVVSKQTAKVSAADLIMKYNDGSVYKAIVKDKSGNRIKNINVKFVINGKTFTQKTDSNGVAKLKITQPVGYYTITSAVSNSNYNTNTVSKHVGVYGIKVVCSDVYVPEGQKAVFSAKVVNAYNKPIKNAKITFKIGNNQYTASSDSNGVVKVSLGVLSKGDHVIKYSPSGSTSSSSKIHVVNKVTISQIIAASRTVKSYIEKNGKLPSSVKIGGISYSTANYLYLASKAIVNLNSNNKGSIDVKNIKNPVKQLASSNLGNLNNYPSVAKNIVKYADSRGLMPNYVTSYLGNIGYQGLVYADCRVLEFYGDNGRLPSYVSVKSLKSATTTLDKKVNSKNTIDNLAAFLAASANCQVNNPKIKSLVQTLTKGKTTDKAKADAIFKYVRDHVSYSFYYDTKHGAVGTLDAKSGNCVDHSHLLVAMYRAAGLPARYVHGSCTFSSGSTYGHVWTQVLIGDTWTVSDATSSRNSLGSVANWNTNSYSYKGTYASLPF